MAFSARLLVVADTAQAAGGVSARLSELGFATKTAAGDGAACSLAGRGAFDAVVIHAPERSLESIAEFAQRLKTAAAPRLLAVIAVAAPDAAGASPHIDAVLRAPVHATQIAARAQLVVRLAIMEDEARLRARTMAARGAIVDIELDAAAFHAPRVLFIGDASPQFLALNRALTDAGAHVTASFSSFTAFDYLHDSDFDALVANAIDGNEPAFTVCAALRRNTRLHHVPALLFVDIDTFKDADEAFARGVSDILAHTAACKEMAARVLSLARERRRREQVKAVFSQARAPSAIDAKTGLATVRFFSEHLENMVDRARAIDRPLSILIARAEPPDDVDDAAGARAYEQLASMLRHLVRAEDLACALEPGVFAVAMPGTDRAAGQAAAQRIEAISECTAFDGGIFGDSFQLRVSTVVAEREDEQRGRLLLARAARAFEQRAFAS